MVAFDENLQTVQIRSATVGSGPEKDGFTFDRVFPPGTKQHEVFDYGVKEYVFLPRGRVYSVNHPAASSRVSD